MLLLGISSFKVVHLCYCVISVCVCVSVCAYLYVCVCVCMCSRNGTVGTFKLQALLESLQELFSGLSRQRGLDLDGIEMSAQFGELKSPNLVQRDFVE